MGDNSLGKIVQASGANQGPELSQDQISAALQEYMKKTGNLPYAVLPQAAQQNQQHAAVPFMRGPVTNATGPAGTLSSFMASRFPTAQATQSNNSNGGA